MAGVGADLPTGVSRAPLEDPIKALLNTQNSARGNGILPQQHTTSLALAALCSFICMYLDYHIYKTALS